MKLSFKNLLLELGITDHFKERLDTRVLHPNLKTNLIFFKDGIKQTEDIGHFTIPDNIMTSIKHNINIITNANVIKDITIVVFLYKFKFYEIMNNTKFYDINDIMKIKSILKYQKGRLNISDEHSKSSGISLIGIIKDGVLITTYYDIVNSKDFLHTRILNGKHGKEPFVILDSPEDIEYYQTSKDRNLNALH